MSSPAPEQSPTRSATDVGTRVSVVICVRNEQDGIANVLAETKPFCDEILVVDGHSTDNTREICAAAGVRVVVDNGRGKGDALRVGIAHATGDILVFMDGDGSHDPRDIPKLIAPLLESKADLVVASRQLGGTDEFDGSLDAYFRCLGAGLITIVMNYRWNVRLTDSQNGFRAIRRSVATSLDLTANGFDIEQQTIARCLRRRLRVVEVPSHEFVRKWGRSKNPTYFGYKLLWRLFLDVVVPWGGAAPVSERRERRYAWLRGLLAVLAAGFLAAAIFLPSTTWIPRPQEIQIDNDLRRFLHDVPGQNEALVRLGALIFRAFLLMDAGLLLWAAWVLARSGGASPRLSPDSSRGRLVPEDGAIKGLLGLLLVAGAGLRLLTLNQDLWLDEISTLVRFSRLPLVNIVASVPSSNNHVLNSVLSHLSITWLGESAAALRFPAMLFGVGGLWAAFSLARTIAGPREALVVTALLTVSYPHIFYSQNARGYSAHLFFALLGTTWFIRAIRGSGRRYWIGYVIVMVLLNYSHLLGLFFLAAHVAAYGILLWERRDLTIVSPTSRRVALASTLVLYLTLHLYAQSLPEIIGLVIPEYSQPAVGWTPSSPALHGMVSSLLANPLFLLALLGGGALGLAGAADSLRRDRFVLALLTFPALITLAGLLSLGVGVYPRFFLFGVPVAYLMIVRGGHIALTAAWQWVRNDRVKKRLEISTAAVLIASALSASVLQLLPYYRLPKQDYRGTLRYLETVKMDGDLVVAVGPAAWGLKLYNPRVYATNSESEITQLRSGCRPVWLVYSFSHEMRVEMPALYTYVQSHFQPVAEFPGTLIGGTLFVTKSKCP